ncbi:putative CHY-type Zn-finger protein [Virgibacillus halotolerans]|uniref:CHY zinc finger protein n=1 Tax=Virgibacillus halotolerans TaxID=1071053 RepID=UPI001960AAE8|nr:CHY zinc finger protein [Virgibacillus halotolerans]MBM7601576.1 putative CHY-type Zn-finger protein [Virgibacillus halotolerans]
MKISEFDIQGAIDQETRCKHYHSEKDLIAIKFYCCNTYYPCYLCHEEHGCGQHTVWPAKDFDQKAILCGNCKTELTIHEYMNNENTCPSCGTLFNAGCSLHHHLYFEKLRE